MNNNTFKILHHLLGSFEYISEIIVKNHYNDYIEISKNIDRKIYCSEHCSRKSSNSEIILLQPSKLNFPVNNLILCCIECNKIIKHPECFYIIDENNSLKYSVNSFIYETTFCNLFLKALILLYIKKYYVEGFNFNLDSVCNYTSSWLSIILNNMQSNIDENSSFFRVQKDLHPDNGIKDLNNKNLMRSPSIVYLKDNRLTKSGVYNLYLSEDVETGKKEIRYKEGEYYYAEFITKKKLTTIDFTTFKDDCYFRLLSESIYKKYSEKYGNNYHCFVIIKSAVDCFKEFIIPMITKQANDDQPFKPEYVISQFISDISKATLVDSIIYSSTRNENKKCLCFFKVGEIDYCFVQKDTIKVTE